MKFVSVTRLRLRHARFLPGFFWHAVWSNRQARRFDANLYTLLHREPGRVFWTITVWPDQAAMRAFRNSGAHQTAMPKLFEWCDEASYVHWQQPDAEAPPDLKTAHRRLVTEGAVSGVRFPSANHATRAFPEPK